MSTTTEVTKPTFQSGDRIRLVGGVLAGADGHVLRVRWVESMQDYVVDVGVNVPWLPWSPEPMAMTAQKDWVVPHEMYSY